MANIDVKDAGAVTRTLKATDNAGVLTPHHNSDSFNVANPSASFTRPADTTAYASGDLVANSTTAGSVVPMSFTAARVSAGGFRVRRARIKKSDATLTNAQFRLHLYGADPSASTGITNGDGAAWLTKHANYIGSIDITVDKAFSDSSAGSAAPAATLHVTLASGQTVWGLLEARAAYVPVSAESFTVALELQAD